MVDEKAVRAGLWGEKAVAPHSKAIEACHAFAQASGCPVGGDVILWLHEQTTRWQEASRAAHEAEKDSR
jgi:hypothetical protein